MRHILFSLFSLILLSLGLSSQLEAQPRYSFKEWEKALASLECEVLKNERGLAYLRQLDHHIQNNLDGERLLEHSMNNLAQSAKNWNRVLGEVYELAVREAEARSREHYFQFSARRSAWKTNQALRSEMTILSPKYFLLPRDFSTNEIASIQEAFDIFLRMINADCDTEAHLAELQGMVTNLALTTDETLPDLERDLVLALDAPQD